MTDKTGAAAAPRTDRLAEHLRRVDYMNWPSHELAEKLDGFIDAEVRAAESGASRRNAIDEIARLGQQIENAESGASPAAEDRGLAAAGVSFAQIREWAEEAREGGYKSTELSPDVVLALLDRAALPHGEPARTTDPETCLHRDVEARQPLTTEPARTPEMFSGTLENEIARSNEPTAGAVLAIAAAFHELDGHKRPLGYHGRGETMRGDDRCPWDARLLYDRLRQRGYELREMRDA